MSSSARKYIPLKHTTYCHLKISGRGSRAMYMMHSQEDAYPTCVSQNLLYYKRYGATKWTSSSLTQHLEKASVLQTLRRDKSKGKMWLKQSTTYTKKANGMPQNELDTCRNCASAWCHSRWILRVFWRCYRGILRAFKGHSDVNQGIQVFGH